MINEELLTIDEAARFLSISKPTLYRLISQESIRGLKSGQRWRFRKADLQAYLTRSPSALIAPPTVELGALLEDIDEDIRGEGGLLAGVDIWKTVFGGGEESSRSNLDTGRVLGKVIELALLREATEIHIEPFVPVDSTSDESSTRLRFRIDGRMSPFREMPASIRDPFLALLKSAAKLNVADRKAPQEGRLIVKLGAQFVNLKVWTVPSYSGESAVVRLNVRSATAEGLDGLMLDVAQRKAIRSMLAARNGLIVCAGLEGSGRTGLLLSLATEVAGPETKLVTVEDPVEVPISDATQIAVNPRSGATYPNVVRAALTLQPDVLMIDAVHDDETEALCLDSPHSGPLVLAGMTATDTIDSITALIDKGYDPFVLTSTIVGVVAISLCRKLCPHCRMPVPPWSRDVVRTRLVGIAGATGSATIANATFYRATGCEQCTDGYKGRIALFEILEMNDKLAEAIIAGVSPTELRAVAVASGMRSFFADGLKKAADGLTTVDEVVSVFLRNRMA